MLPCRLQTPLWKRLPGKNWRQKKITWQLLLPWRDGDGDYNDDCDGDNDDDGDGDDDCDGDGDDDAHQGYSAKTENRRRSVGTQRPILYLQLTLLPGHILSFALLSPLLRFGLKEYLKCLKEYLKECLKECLKEYFRVIMAVLGKVHISLLRFGLKECLKEYFRVIMAALGKVHISVFMPSVNLLQHQAAV